MPSPVVETESLEVAEYIFVLRANQHFLRPAVALVGHSCNGWEKHDKQKYEQRGLRSTREFLKKLVVLRAFVWKHFLSMSEFKFACPVCGQHITADSASTGSQLECPTCYRKIVVPQAPTSTDPKFILSAAEANKPRPPKTSLPTLDPISAKPARPLIPLAIIAILLLLTGTALAIFREKIFGHKPSTGTQLAGAQNAEANKDAASSGKNSAPVPIVT